MDYVKCILVFLVLVVIIEAGGHGEKHHNHVRVHVPKFVHHDHHTKTITIHHHHHKPKKEQHHHHHHHHHKPKAPEGHHYHHHHKKTSTHSVSKGHSSHGSHGHHGHHGHQGHEHKHHDTPLTYDSPTIHYDPPNYEPPLVNYQPPSTSYNPTLSLGDDFGFKSSIPGPSVRGIVQTVKQTKVFDSLPNAFSGAGGNLGNTASHGYEVTEQGDEAEDDIFTAVNSLSQTHPGTYGFIRNADSEDTHDPFAETISQNSNQISSSSFPAAPGSSVSNVQDFSNHNDPFQSPIPSQSIQPSAFSSDFDDSISVTSHDPNNIVGYSSAEDIIDETPTTFNRVAGIQQTINTGGIESLAY